MAVGKIFLTFLKVFIKVGCSNVVFALKNNHAFLPKLQWKQAYLHAREAPPSGPSRN